MWNFEIVFTVTFLVLWIPGTAQKNITKNDQHSCSTNKHCICVPLTDGYIKADCSRQRLRIIPTFFENVTFIDLSYNEIQEIPDNLDFPSTLEELDFSVNNISSLDVDAFRKMPNLRSLSLMCNALQYNESVFKKGVFSSLANLNTLQLHHNIADDISFELYPTAISELQSLATLTLDGKEGARFGSSFRNLTKLQRMTISGIEGKCDITWLPETFFNSTPFIEYLDLTGCNLLQMDKGLLQPLIRLNSLNISHNILLTFLVLPNITYDLQWTNIKVLNITKIHCTYGPGTMLLTSDTAFLRNTTLTRIIFDSNRLVMADAEVISSFPISLEIISFRDNRLTMGSYIFQLIHLHELKEINGDNQYTSHTPDTSTNWFEICYDWRGPDKRKLTKVSYLHPSRCRNSHSDKPRNRDSNPLQKIPPIPISRNLSEIYFSNSDLQYPIPELTFVNNSVTKLTLNDNLLYSWIGPVRNLHQLVYLDLSNNFCSEIKDTFLSDVPSLEFLNISHNLLGFNFGDILPFQSVGKLETLDFSFNRLQNLSINIFGNLTSLMHLHLQSNILRHWQFNVGHMAQLNYLDVSNNQLVSIPKRIRNQLYRIASKGKLKINLDGNRLKCDCSNIDFIKWMINIQRDHRVFVNFNSYSCSTNNDTVINFSQLSDFLIHLTASCELYSFLIVGELVAVLVSVSMVISGLVYRYRWRLRYLYYMTKAQYSGQVVVRHPENRQDYQYDAFISYAAEDENFVKNSLRNELEKSHLRLCLHQRDFLLGNTIAENITLAINNSYKTVIIFSENYMNSGWCMYELNMAKVTRIYSRREANMIVFVMYKKVEMRNIPSQILDLVESDTYIEYSNDPERRDNVFYDTLANAINRNF